MGDCTLSSLATLWKGWSRDGETESVGGELEGRQGEDSGENDAQFKEEGAKKDARSLWPRVTWSREILVWRAS